MTITWELLGTIFGIVALIVGAATTYLRMYVSGEMSRMRDEIVARVTRDFPSREIIDERIRSLRDRVVRIEERLGFRRRWDGEENAEGG